MAAPPRPKGGLSLYDNLADPSDSSATISSAPVSYTQTDPAASESSAAAKKPLDPALRFQPIRRPQAKQPSKPKGFFPKGAATISKPPIPAAAVAAPPTDASTAAPPSAPAPAPAKSTLADWATTEDDEWRYGGGGGAEKRQRGGRKRKKRKQEMQVETDWDEIYDPTRPTNVDEYLRSDEKISEVREWRALLYRHRRRSDRDSMSTDEEDERPSFSSAISLDTILVWTRLLTISNRSVRTTTLVQRLPSATVLTTRCST
jgi:splicing factor 45